MKYSEIFHAHEGKVSDKWSSYLSFYDELTENFQPKTILEIGVQNGGSLEIWSKKYPNAQLILGIDVDPKCGELKFEHPAIKVLVMDASQKATALEAAQFCGGFDLIIDDGSHVSRDIIASLKHFLPLLRTGGKYVVEDLHASYWPSWDGGLFHGLSSMNFLKRIADVVNHEHWDVNLNVESYFGETSLEQDFVESLSRVKSVSFLNSLGLLELQDGPVKSPELGSRVYAGSESIVTGNTDFGSTERIAPERVEIRKDLLTLLANPDAVKVLQPLLEDLEKQSLELTMQRDAVVAERDAVVAERDAIVSSRIWRWTKLVRGF